MNDMIQVFFEYDVDNKINVKYLYDLLFQYHVYKNFGLKIKNVGYLFTNRLYKLKTLAYPVVDEELDELFIEKKVINLKYRAEFIPALYQNQLEHAVKQCNTINLKVKVRS